MRHRVIKTCLIGVFTFFIKLNVEAQWTRDASWLNTYLSNSGDKVLLNNSTYFSGAVNFKLDVRGTVRATDFVRGTRFVDENNTAFSVDPDATSFLNDVRGSIFYDRDNTSFYANPASLSIFNEINAGIVRDRDNAGFYVDPASTSVINKLQVTEIDNDVDIDGNIFFDQSTILYFLPKPNSGPCAGGNGQGKIGHSLGGFFVEGPSYGSDCDNVGGGIGLKGGLSELSRGGDIILDGGPSNSSRNGYVLLDAENKSSVGVGFNSLATLQAKLDVNGSVRATSYITVSDGNLKENTKEITGALNKIQSLRGVTYSFKKSSNNIRNVPSSAQIGFIAQEVEKVIPEAVFTDSDGIKGVDYNKIIPVLLEAVKEQQRQIEVLREELNSRATKSPEDGGKVNRLFQNIPNPSNSSTTIKYELEVGKPGELYIFDFSGNLKKKYSLGVNTSSIEIQANEFAPGLYVYSLVVGGRETDTLRMIIN